MKKQKKINKNIQKQEQVNNRKKNKRSKLKKDKVMMENQKICISVQDKGQNIQPSNQQQQQIHMNNMQQQIRQAQQYRQGYFQQNIHQLQQNTNIINRQDLYIASCKFAKGYMCMLDINKCYKLFNNSANRCDIYVIDGNVDINGKLYSELFYVPEQANTLIYTKKNKINRITQPNQSNNKKYINKNIQQILQKIPSKLIKQQITQQLQSYLHDYQTQQNILLYSQSDIRIKYMGGEANWHNINVERYVSDGQVTMLVGLKNTGKSTFCQYIFNYCQTNKNEICIMDVDIGRNRLYPGSVSLSYRNNKNIVIKQDKSIWIGQYTPLNMISTYIKGIHQLYNDYKNKYYTSSLIINTMGYVTGIGQLIIYEIYNITKPQCVLIMQSDGKNQQWSVNNIIKNISSGMYVERLYFKIQNQISVRTSTKICKYTNIHAEQKSFSDRFQPLITSYTIKSITDLIFLIITRKLTKLDNIIKIYHNDKAGNITALQNISFDHYTDMRIVIFARISNSRLFQVQGVGFGWNNAIYFDKSLYNPVHIQIGIISQGIDFEKNFYIINQSKIIQIQEILGHRIPYLCQNFKSLGNKGMRNNPGKKIVNNKI